MPDVQGFEQSWAVVVPVKRLPLAKTRLSLPSSLRAAVALAMAEDTVRACAAATLVDRVVVVTDDAEAARMARSAGALVVADEPDAGLNPALRHGAAAAGAEQHGRSVATVSSDLPALTPADLDAVLARAAGGTAVVADAAGTGTTLLAASRAEDFLPAFGAGSLEAHVRAGAVDLTAYAGPGLRRDVDTVTDLHDAWRIGCGSATRRALEAAGGIEALTGGPGRAVD